jgi:predicted protein tyrosine phosphatase
MTLIVCSLFSLPEVIEARRPSHVLTLLSPEVMIDALPGFAPDRHLRLTVHDIHEPTEGMIAPDEAMVRQVLAFGRAWDESGPLLVHCFAGISRSTASAFVIACDRNPDADELEIAISMRRRSPQAFPNRRIVALADDILGRRGRMLAAVEAMGGNDFVDESVPFELPASLPMRAAQP